MTEVTVYAPLNNTPGTAPFIPVRSNDKICINYYSFLFPFDFNPPLLYTAIIYGVFFLELITDTFMR
jgi:hypothetical protein